MCTKFFGFKDTFKNIAILYRFDYSNNIQSSDVGITVPEVLYLQ